MGPLMALAEEGGALVGNWAIVEIRGVSLIEDSGHGLGFSEDGRVSATAGCNRLSTGFDSSDEGLAIGIMVATRMMCSDPLMQQEAALIDVLETVRQYEIDNDVLLLYDADGEELLAASRDESPASGSR